MARMLHEDRRKEDRKNQKNFEKCNIILQEAPEAENVTDFNRSAFLKGHEKDQCSELPVTQQSKCPPSWEETPHSCFPEMHC